MFWLGLGEAGIETATIDCALDRFVVASDTL